LANFSFKKFFGIILRKVKKENRKMPMMPKRFFKKNFSHDGTTRKIKKKEKMMPS
jgi:hypothetical protein